MEDRKQNMIIYLIGFSLLVLGIAVLFSINDLKDQVKRIEASQSKIQNKILNRNKTVNFDFTEGFAIGDSAAPINMAIFLDYECGYCKLFFLEVYPLLYDDYISKGLLRFVIMDFPLSSHENALPLAQYSRCAQQNGSYGSFINKVFEYPDVLDMTALEKIGNEIDLNPAVCLQDSSHYNEILKDKEIGKSLGVSGTPTFIINDQLIVGYKKYPKLQSILNSTLVENEGACK